LNPVSVTKKEKPAAKAVGIFFLWRAEFTQASKQKGKAVNRRLQALLSEFGALSGSIQLIPSICFIEYQTVSQHIIFA